MPKLVKELPSGNSAARSSQDGRQADSMSRTWRVILDAPDETYDIQQAVGVRVGDPHPVNTGVPCVSISERPDGESRLVRLVTASYQTTPGGNEDPQNDPKLQSPEIRVAKWSVDASTTEIPAPAWGLADEGGTLFERPLNPAKDPIDGVFKVIPVLKYNFEQFEQFWPANVFQWIGGINDRAQTFKGVPIPKHSCMFRGLTARPHAEFWGEQLFRGYMVTYEFVQRFDTSGWNIVVPLSGFNCINDGLEDAEVEQGALTLELTDGGRIKDWPNPQLVMGTQGRKVRANILIAHFDGGAAQRPSAQPVPLNADGRPRATTADPPVLFRTYRTQDEFSFGDNFADFKIRLD